MSTNVCRQLPDDAAEISPDTFDGTPNRAEGFAGAKERRFCQVFLAITCLTFLAVAGTNYVVNPYAQYATKWLEPLVQTSRTQKVHLVAVMQPVPRGLILGSSRVMKLEPDYLERQTGYPFFNAGMNHGKPEDFLAFLRYYQDTFLQAPAMVVIGLDVQSFTDGSPPDARLLSHSELARRVPEAIDLSDRMQRWRELLSWQQTKMSAKSLKLNLLSGTTLEPVESFRDDGLIVYHQRERELIEGTYDFVSALDYNKREYKQLFQAFQKLSPVRCELFEQIAKICRANGTKLVVYLTPLHPALVHHLEQHTNYRERHDQVVGYLQTQAARNRFTFWDLTEIGSFAGDASQFVDGIHPLEPNTRRIIDRILTTQPGNVDYAVQ